MCFRNGASHEVARRVISLRNRLWTGACLTAAAAGMMLSGCSGGSSHGSSSSTPTPTPSASASAAAPVTVTAEIAWPARSRVVSTIPGTAAALSATITLTGTGTTGIVTVTAARPAGTAAVTSTYTLTGSAIPGSLYGLTVNFYTGANAAGTLVATAAQANTLVQSDGTLLATVITIADTFSTVKITGVAPAGTTTASSSILVGQADDVLYSFYNISGALVAPISATNPSQVYGSGFVTIGSGSTNYLRVGTDQDQIVGLAPSTGASFTISVDGITSNIYTLPVTTTEKVTVSPSGTSASPLILNPGIAQTFTATIIPASTDAAPGVTWSLGAGSVGTLTNAAATTVTYTPPSALTSVGDTVTLIATSTYDPTATATVTILLQSLVSVSVSPTSASLSFDQTQQFMATVTDDPTSAGVTWTVTGGTLSTATTASGTATTYTAPTTAGTYTLTATSVYDKTKTASATITVKSTVGLSVTPTSATLSLTQTQAFTATVTNDPASEGVKWTVTGGSLSTAATASGTPVTYTAPTTAGTYTLTATSVLDPTVSTSVTITVKSTVSIQITIPSTTSINLFVNHTQTFIATVSNTFAGSTGVTWSATGGTISPTTTASGSGTTYTARSTAGTYIVTATSALDPTKTATVTIYVRDVSFSITPTSKTLSINGIQQFAVNGLIAGDPNSTVTNPLGSGITWSILEGATGGTIDSTGFYTAPSSVAMPSGTTFHIIATSVYDSSVSVTIPVTVQSGTATGTIQ